MKRVVFLLVLVALVAAGIWFAMSEPSAPSKGGRPAEDLPADPGRAPQRDVAPVPTKAPDAAATRRETATAPEEARTAVVLAGTIRTADEAPLGGALVEVFAVPAEDTPKRGKGGFLRREMMNDLLGEMEAEVEDVAEESSPTRRVKVQSGNLDVEIESAEEDIDELSEGLESLGDMDSFDDLFDVAREELYKVMRDQPFEKVGEARSAADGTFRIEGVASGKLELRIRAQGHVRSKKRADAGRTGVVVRMEPGFAVSGAVTSAAGPVAGAEVLGGFDRVVAGPDGKFSLDALPKDDAFLVAEATGHVTRIVMVDPPADGAAVVDIEMVPAGSIAGTVRLAGDAPAEGATVKVVKAVNLMQLGMMGGNKAKAMEMVLAPRPQAVADAAGHYVLEGIAAGKVNVSASLAGWLDGKAGPVEVAQARRTDGVDIELAKASALVGRITGPGGAPVAGAKVKVEKPKKSGGGGMEAMLGSIFGGGFLTGETDGEGRYRVEGLPGGKRKVRVESDSHLTLKGTVELPDGADHTWDAQLEAAFILSGVVQGPDGAPVEGASVTFSWDDSAEDSPAGMFAGLLSGGSGVKIALTDSEGRFRAEGLQTGPWDVAVNAAGYLPFSREDLTAEDDGLTLTLAPAGTVRGRILDAAGAPVPGARVACSATDGGEEEESDDPMIAVRRAFSSTSMSSESSEDGTFEVVGLAGGSFELSATKSGFSKSAPLTVAVREGEVTEDVELVLLPAVAISGRVVRASDGGAVEGAVVAVAVDRGGFGHIDWETEPDAAAGPDAIPSPEGAVSARTDAGGAFVVEGVAAGKVTVEVRARGFASMKLEDVEAPGSGLEVRLALGGAVEGRVVGKDGAPKSGVNLVLQQGMMDQVGSDTTDSDGRYRIDFVPAGNYRLMMIDVSSGNFMPKVANVAVREGEITVHDFGGSGARPTSTVTGRIVHEADGDVAGMMVLLMGSGMKMGTTESDGTFRFEDVEGGKYTVLVQKGIMGGGASSVQVEVPAGRDVNDVILRISGLVLSGTVLDPDGKPVHFAQVQLVDPRAGDEESMTGMLSRHRGQAFTGEDGSFRMEGVPAGVFQLRVSGGGFVPAFVPGVSAGGSAVEVRMEKGASVVVRVEDADGAPVAGMHVTHEDAQGNRSSALDMSSMGRVTDAEGRVTLTLRPGEYTFRASGAGHPGGEVRAAAGGGDIVIRLPAAGTLDVTVTDGSGAPVVGAIVVVRDASGRVVHPALDPMAMLAGDQGTDADGRHHRAGLPAGEYEVEARLPGGTPARAKATVRAGLPTNVQVKLR